ncbi:hypothetical protein C8R45DRAFT_1039269, partial [Mycena sanguinolenta]
MTPYLSVFFVAISLVWTTVQNEPCGPLEWLSTILDAHRHRRFAEDVGTTSSEYMFGIGVSIYEWEPFSHTLRETDTEMGVHGREPPFACSCSAKWNGQIVR